MSDIQSYVVKKKRRKRNNAAYILELVLCLVALSAIFIAIGMVFKYHSVTVENENLNSQLAVYNDPEKPYYSSDEVDSMVSEAYDRAFLEGKDGTREEVLSEIKSSLLTTNSSSETLKKLYPDELIVVDNNKYYFFPIDRNLKCHDFSEGDFVREDNGRIAYTGNGQFRTGIDVSKFQDKIKWAQVAQDNIDFAIIRAGFRGYSKGEVFEDEQFETNIKGALKNGIDVGIYFLTQATSEEEALEEANFCLDKLEPYDLKYPVVLDVEAVGGNNGRGNALSIEDRTKYAKTFLDTVKQAGYDVCIYGNIKTFLLMLDMKELEDYPKWFAGYTDNPYFPYEMDFWQYTESGTVKGISEPVDINIYFE